MLQRQAAEENKFAVAARATIDDLKAARWLQVDAVAVDLIFSTYTPGYEMVSIIDVEVPLKPSGYVHPLVKCASMFVNPYWSAGLFVIDGVFISFVLYQLLNETRQLIGDTRAIGMWDALVANSEIWNIIDWLAIVCGVLTSSIWICCVLKVRDPILRSLIDDEIGRLQPHILDMSASDFEGVNDHLQSAAVLFNWLHISMSFNVVAIVMKFFKGFKANERLHAVMLTFVQSSVELLHWAVVFFCIFVAFGMVAHILFGQDIHQFRNLQHSLSTCFSVMLGEFEWYANAVDETNSDLPSGIPRFLLQIWFVFYVGMTLLVMLNMLLAIILETYAGVTNAVKGAPTIWLQAANYFRRRKQTTGFLDLRALLLRLQDDDTVIHTERLVTKTSLMEAFPDMKDAQAIWLLAWLEDEATAAIEREREDRHSKDESGNGHEGHITTLTNEIHLMHASVTSSSAKISELYELANPAETNQLDSYKSEKSEKAETNQSKRHHSSDDLWNAVSEIKAQTENNTRTLRLLVDMVSKLPGADKAKSALQL